MSKIKELTKQEAIEIITDIVDVNDCIGSGSSRAVYPYYYNSINCVVKIACDKEGRAQNRVECGLYEDNDDADSYLGIIYAKYQDYFHIMEYVEPFSYDFLDDIREGHLYDRCEQEYEYVDEETSEVVTNNEYKDYGFNSWDAMHDAFNDVQYVAKYLCKRAGYTNDNYQIGTNDNGVVKAYDYGYDIEIGYSALVGNIDAFCPAEYMYKTLTCDLDIDRYLDDDDGSEDCE